MKKKIKPWSMFAPYQKEIVALLDEGRSIKQIYRDLIYPAMNGGCSYCNLVHYINSNELRSAADHDGYEVVPACRECVDCKVVKRCKTDAPDLKICRMTMQEINRQVKHSPRWCPKRDLKRQGEV